MRTVKKKHWVVLILLISILIPLAISINLAAIFTYDEYQESLEFYYEPETDYTELNLKVKSDVSNISLRRLPIELNANLLIEVEFAFSGPFVAGKNYKNFFQEVNWSNYGNDIEFTLEKLPNVEIDQLNFNSEIIIYQNPNFLYSLEVETNSGNINVNPAEKTSMGKLNVSSNTGNVSLASREVNFQGLLTAESGEGNINFDLSECTFSSNLMLKTYSGEIRLTGSNLRSESMCEWGVFSEQGNIFVELSQTTDLGINVAGEINSKSGTIDLKYFDSSNKVGAKFTALTFTGAVSFLDDDTFYIQTTIGTLQVFTSFDFNRANYNYNLIVATNNAPVIIRVNSTI